MCWGTPEWTLSFFLLQVARTQTLALTYTRAHTDAYTKCVSGSAVTKTMSQRSDFVPGPDKVKTSAENRTNSAVEEVEQERGRAQSIQETKRENKLENGLKTRNKC